MTQKGKFIVFEGIDGSGKSTQAKLLAAKLREQGQEVYYTFEPSDGMIGKMIRRILTKEITADEHTIAALFLADRLDHLNNPETGILSKLEKGIHVISDRYYYSSYAYHSMFMSMDWVIQANSLAADIKRPDVVFYLDLTPEQSFERISQNRENLEHYEKVDSLRAARDNYLEAIRREGKADHVQTLSAMGTMEEIHANILSRTEALFEGILG